MQNTAKNLTKWDLNGTFMEVFCVVVKTFGGFFSLRFKLILKRRGRGEKLEFRHFAEDRNFN